MVVELIPTLVTLRNEERQNAQTKERQRLVSLERENEELRARVAALEMAQEV